MNINLNTLPISPQRNNSYNPTFKQDINIKKADSDTYTSNDKKDSLGKLLIQAALGGIGGFFGYQCGLDTAYGNALRRGLTDCPKENKIFFGLAGTIIGLNLSYAIFKSVSKFFNGSHDK